jgi:hypothetical protein
VINVNGGCRLLRTTSKYGPTAQIPGDVSAGLTWPGFQSVAEPRLHILPGVPEASVSLDSGRRNKALISEKSLYVIHHIRYRQLGGIQLNGIMCRFEWRHDALHIARVSSLNLF